MENKEGKGSAEPRAGYVWDPDKLAWVRPTEPKGEESTADLSQPPVETKGESSPAEATVEATGEEGAVEAAIEVEGLEYKGALARLVAFIIDSIVLIIISIILTAALGTETTTVEGEVTEAGIITWVLLAVFLVYFVGFWTWRGQTPGKIVMGAKIVKTNGSPISLVRAFLRSILFFVYLLIGGLAGNYINIFFVFALVVFIVIITIAFSMEKRGLHDRIAGTCVINSRARARVVYTAEEELGEAEQGSDASEQT